MKEVNEAIYDALAAHSDLAVATGSRFYRGEAPQGATHPLVTYQKTGGGERTDNPGDNVDLLYLVQAVSMVSADDADVLAGYLHEALHKVTLTVSGWVNIWTMVAGHLDPVELSVGGELVWHAGRQVRIRLSR